MSLEDSINENTAVMRELIATLKGAASAPDAQSQKPKAEKVKPAAKADVTVPAIVDRAAVTKKLVQVGKSAGREAALGILKKYGAKNLGEVADDNLAAVEAELDQVLETEQVAA